MAKEKIHLLDVVPFISEHIETIKEGDLSVVTFPRFPNAFMQKMFSRFARSERIHIRLDAYGSAVWNLIDGQRTVGEICGELAGSFAGEENLEARIVTFMSQLQAQGFIIYKVGL